MTADLRLRPESEFILWCLRRSLGSVDGVPPICTASDFDWTYVRDVSRQAGIAPLIFDVLDPIAEQCAPAPTWHALRRDRNGNRAVDLFRFKQLGDLLNAFHEHGIQTIVLKGSALAETVYAARTSRPMGDIDILVREDDVSRAEDTLVELGYRLDEWIEQDYHARYSKDRVVPIEVHWRLAPPWLPIQIDLEGIWKCAAPARIAGSSAFVLSAEDLLLHLCVHAAGKDQLQHALQALCDVTLTIGGFGDGLDWEAIEDRARGWRIEKYAYLTLRLARQLLGARVPDRTLSALEPVRLPSDLLGWAARTVLEGYVAPPVTFNFVRFWASRGFTERARALAHRLSPDAVARHYALPRRTRQVYFHVPSRLAGLFRHYAPVIARVWLGDPESRHMMESQHAAARLADWLGAHSERPQRWPARRPT